MNHAPEGQLQAYLDHELGAAAQAAMEAHLAECSRCAAACESLRALSFEVAAALHTLEVEPPLERAVQSFARARRAAAERPSLRRVALGSLLKAAGLLLVLAGSVAAAIPGSPVRQWLVSAWHGVGSLLPGDRVVESPVVPPAPTDATAQPAAPAAVAGVSIQPVEGGVRILLQSAVPDAPVRFRLVDASRASVTPDNASARFRTGAGWMEVVSPGPGETVIEVPRHAANAAVYVNGRLVVSKQGQKVQVLGVPADTVGEDLVFRVPS